MSLSRWKMMAGVLGVSLGGLAAASQCPKSDGQRQTSRQADPPAPLEAPTLPAPPPPAGGPAPKPMPPASPPAPALPDAKAPAAPVLELPGLPTTPASKPPDLPTSTPAMPPKVDTEPNTIPPLPGTVAEPTKPTTTPLPGTKTLPGSTGSAPPAPTVDPAVRPATGSAAPQPDLPPAKASPPTVSPPAIGPDPLIETKPEAKPEVLRPAPANAAAPKYRILLQVGEGEPRFEVKSGDDLVLKVVCERVDVKSPEKGGGPSAVKASGKVRFVGFGAEGTCDELSFLAGTGEVGMAGAVKIQVKDKLGRVESELSADSMKYRIDAAAVVGSVRP